MTKIVFLITLIFATFFLLKCNHANQKENITEVKKDSSSTTKNTESSTKSSSQSEITCPKCGYKKIQIMPTDVCLIKYTCDSCAAVSYSKDGDCCVFCSYGTHKCPSKQVE